MGSRTARGVRLAALVVLLLVSSAVGPLAWGPLREAFGVTASVKPVVVPVAPFRLVDTRPAPDDPSGGPDEPFGQGVTRTYQVAGVQSVPADAVGVVLNITALQAATDSFIAVFPAGSGIPNTSTLNPAPGRTVFNSATVLLGGGKFSVFHNAGSVHVIIDVVGYLQDHNHDERYLEQSAPVVMAEPVSAFRPYSSTGPTSTGVLGAALVSSADGILSLPLSAPVSVGGTSYRLTQIEYCITIPVAGGFVAGLAVASDALTSGLPATFVANDLTDRTATGCYAVNVAAGSARSYGLLIQLGGSASATAIYIHGVRSTWTPATGAAAVVEDPSAAGDLAELFGPGVLESLLPTG